MPRRTGLVALLIAGTVVAAAVLVVLTARRPSVTARMTIRNDLPNRVWVGVVREDGSCIEARIPPGAEHRFDVFQGEATEDLHRTRFVIVLVDPSGPRVEHTIVEGHEVDRLGVLEISNIVRKERTAP